MIIRPRAGLIAVLIGAVLFGAWRPARATAQGEEGESGDSPSLPAARSSARDATSDGQIALARAMEAYERSELDRCAAELATALGSGTLHPPVLAQVHRLQGILAVADGDTVRATRSFQLSLALNPEQETPAELGPAEAALFDGIRAGGMSLSLRTESTAVEGGAVRIQVEALGAPAGAIATFRWRSPGALAPSNHGRFDVPAPEAARRDQPLAFVIDAQDAAGNILATVEGTYRWPSVQVPTAHEVAEESEGSPPPPPEQIPVGPNHTRRRRIILGVTSAVVLVASAVTLGIWAARRPVETRVVPSTAALGGSW